MQALRVVVLLLLGLLLANGDGRDLDLDLDQTTQLPKTWECSGPLVKTYDQCGDLGSKGIDHGCFYMDGVGYESCQKICNGISVSSGVDVRRCRAYCPKYLDQACRLSADPTPAPEPSRPTSGPVSSADNGWKIAAGVCGGVVGFVILIVVLVLLVGMKRRLRTRWCWYCHDQLACCLCCVAQRVKWLHIHDETGRPPEDHSDSDSVDTTSDVQPVDLATPLPV